MTRSLTHTWHWTRISGSHNRDADAADTAEPTIVTAPLPPQILPRALATPSLLAHILSDKFCDGLPFHRQECMD